MHLLGFSSQFFEWVNLISFISNRNCSLLSGGNNEAITSWREFLKRLSFNRDEPPYNDAGSFLCRVSSHNIADRFLHRRDIITFAAVLRLLDYHSYAKMWCKLTQFLGFEVLTAVVMKSTILGDMTPCNPLSVNWRFGGTYRLHI
jgi:hypothetical protein